MLFNSQETSIDPDYARQMLGSWFIASLLSTMLYAATCGQVAYYCCHYLPRDNLTVKSLVLLIWILDTLTTISDVYNVWSLAILGHGTAFASLMFPKLYNPDYALISIITFAVQIFYVHAIWAVIGPARSRWIRVAMTAVPTILSSTALAFGFAGVSSSSRHMKILFNEVTPLGILITVPACACSAAAADVFICIALSWILYDRKTGFKQTDNLIRTITVYLINRSILTTALQITVVCMFFGLKQRSHQVDMTWIAVRCAEGKVHVNSMLAVLNGRHHMREKLMMPQSGLQITTGPFHV